MTTRVKSRLDPFCMYCEYYGFSEEPFDITPNPKFLFLSPRLEELLTTIIYGIQGRRGLIAIIGEVGTGKTTLLHTAFSWLSKDTKVAYVINFDITFEEMLNMALAKLRLLKSDQSLSKAAAIRLLNKFALHQLSKGGNVALIVDEAQNLSRNAMENLRLLSNLETPQHKLVQIILSGQPELDTKLEQPELRQLSQRISLRRTIKPLKEAETYEYIQHRLSVVNYSGPQLFLPGAQKMIWEFSGGIPRKINILCDNALMTAFRKDIKHINTATVEEAVITLNWKPAV